MSQTTRRKAIHAEEMAAHYLSEANRLSEYGKKEMAEKLYEKSQYWLDRYKKLAGNS